MILLAFGWKKEIFLLQDDLEDDDNHNDDNENKDQNNDDKDDYDDNDDEYLTDVALLGQEDSGCGNFVGGTSGSQSKDLTSVFFFCFCRI